MSNPVSTTSDVDATISTEITDIASSTSSSEPSDTWQQLDQNYVQAERLGGVIFIAILSFVLLIVWLVLSLAVFSPFELRSWLIGLGVLTVCALLGYWVWVHPQWNFDTTRWREIHRGFEIRRGIWWWHQIFIPRERIQHTDVVRGPLMRRFGLAKLIIYTAGTHHHEIGLEGLNADRAERLRQSLLPQSSLSQSNPLKATLPQPSPTPSSASSVPQPVPQPISPIPSGDRIEPSIEPNP